MGGSKICPVCKVFSSSSNTTLNAHIDQCLSGESTMKWTANREVVVEHRIKHRKMKLMVDIYKTAPHCTVEDLDARNGTSWANDLSFSDQEVELQGVQEKEEPAATSIVDYNTNRTKVRILSVPKVDNYTPNDRARKKNKNCEPKHDQKYLKQSRNSRKSSSEVENIDNEECCNKVAVCKDDLSIVRPPWACSKRTSLAKKNLSVAGEFKRQNSQKMGTLTSKKAYIAKKFLLSTKPSFEHLKKHDIILQCEDPSYSCRVKGSDVRSKGSKLSSSRENLLSVSKRTLDSLEQKSGVEEDTSGKTSCESMSLLEVKKNEKIEKMEICRPEKSVSSTSFIEVLCDVESVTNDTRSNKEQAMFDSRERVIDVTVDIEKQQQHYHDMSDSPVSTISNRSLTRSESDKFSVTRNNEKHSPVTLTSSSDWRPKDQSQSQTTSFKNDHQPCCCSRKEVSSSQTPPPPPPLPMKVQPYRECDYPLKPVIRLMGKDLTVVNTGEDKVNSDEFPNGFRSQQYPTFHPPNSLKNNAFLDTMFRNSYTYADYYYVHGNRNPANQDPKNLLAFNNESFLACSPFMEVGSSRSSAIFSRFS